MTDYEQSRDVLVEILKDNGYDDEDCSFVDNYFEKRITDLNRLVMNEFNAKRRSRRQVRKLRTENKRLKDENNEILTSNSWKITKPLRKLRNR